MSVYVLTKAKNQFKVGNRGIVVTVVLCCAMACHRMVIATLHKLSSVNCKRFTIEVVIQLMVKVVVVMV